MTYKEIHQLNLNINNILNNQFKEQLLEIHPRAHLCYQPHCEKFTVSLFILEEGINPFEWNESLSTNVNLLSAFDIDDKIKTLTYAISAFIVDEGPTQ